MICRDDLKCHFEDLPPDYPLYRLVELYALRVLENEEIEEARKK